MLKSRKEGKEGTESYIRPSSRNSLQIFYLNFFKKCCVLLLSFLLFLSIENLSFQDLEMSLESPQGKKKTCLFPLGFEYLLFFFLYKLYFYFRLSSGDILPFKMFWTLSKCMATYPVSYTAVHTSVKSRQEGRHSLLCQGPVASWSLGGWLCQP